MLTQRDELTKDIEAIGRVLRMLDGETPRQSQPDPSLPGTDRVDDDRPATPERRQGRIQALRDAFASDATKAWTALELAEHLGEPTDEATMRSYYGALSRLKRHGYVVTQGRGRYRLATNDSAPAATGAEASLLDGSGNNEGERRDREDQDHDHGEYVTRG